MRPAAAVRHPTKPDHDPHGPLPTAHPDDALAGGVVEPAGLRVAPAAAGAPLPVAPSPRRRPKGPPSVGRGVRSGRRDRICDGDLRHARRRSGPTDVRPARTPTEDARPGPETVRAGGRGPGTPPARRRGVGAVPRQFGRPGAFHRGALLHGARRRAARDPGDRPRAPADGSPGVRRAAAAHRPARASVAGRRVRGGRAVWEDPTAPFERAKRRSRFVVWGPRSFGGTLRIGRG